MVDPKGEVGGTTSTTSGMLLANAAAAVTSIRPSCSGVESVGEAVRAHAHAHAHAHMPMPLMAWYEHGMVSVEKLQ